MQKLFEFLRKLNTPLAYAIALIIIGALFILLPSAVLDILILLFGVLLILFSLIRITIYVSDKRGGVISFELLTDILLGICGVALTSMQSGVTHLICRVLGLIISLYALAKLLRHSKTVQIRDRRFWLTAAVYIALVVVGLWLGFFPLWPKVMAGIAALILAGKFIHDYIETKRDAHGKMENGVFYTDDFEDKT